MRCLLLPTIPAGHYQGYAVKNLLFSFEELGTRPDAASRKVAQQFGRAGASVVQTDVSPRLMRSSGVTYREIRLTHADSQTTTLRIKQTGDVFQVLVNGKVLPIANQDDHGKAIAEVVKALDTSRAAYQKKLAAAVVKPPPGIRTAAPRMEAVLTEKRDNIKAAITAVREEISKLNPTAVAA